MRYDRNLIETTVKAIQRVGEIQRRRERAFYNNRCVNIAVPVSKSPACMMGIFSNAHGLCRMSIAKEKLRQARLKKKESRKTKDAEYNEFIKARDAEEEAEIEVDTELVQPEERTTLSVEKKEKIKEKIAVKSKRPSLSSTKTKARSSRPSALQPAGGRSMGMEVD